MCAKKDWRNGLTGGRLKDRCAQVYHYLEGVASSSSLLYERTVLSPMDRRVLVQACFESSPREMLMLGSNNYLGLANHPRIKIAVEKAMAKYGIGVAGPMLLNGTTELHRKLERQLAEFKGHEAACLFSSGYQANLAIAHTLITSKDAVLYDESSHASLIRGLRQHIRAGSTSRPMRFRHNDLEDLERRLTTFVNSTSGDLFVGVEGVYSMEGDVTDLKALDKLRKKYGFLLVLDDAHGLGVLGDGRGTEHHCNVRADISMGTFSKSLAMTGGYIAGSKELVRYLKYFAEASVFSASLPISSVAAVLEGLKIIKKEPERVERLQHNARQLEHQLRQIGYSVVSGESSIITIPIPREVDIRNFNLRCHEKGLFLNCIEPPAVPASKQMLRLSVSALHTAEDLCQTASILQQVGSEFMVLGAHSCLAS